MLVTGRMNYTFESNTAHFKHTGHHLRSKLWEVVLEAWEQMPGYRNEINSTVVASVAQWFERLPLPSFKP